MARPLTQQGRRLKRATRELVRSLGGIEVAAADCGHGKSTVHRWTDHHDGEHFINVEALATLEGAAERPIVTEQLARMAGGLFVLLPVDGADRAQLGEVADHMFDVIDRTGALAGGVRIALHDERCSPEEREHLRGLLDELIRATCAFRLRLEDGE